MIIVECVGKFPKEYRVATITNLYISFSFTMQYWTSSRFANVVFFFLLVCQTPPTFQGCLKCLLRLVLNVVCRPSPFLPHFPFC